MRVRIYFSDLFYTDNRNTYFLQKIRKLLEGIKKNKKTEVFLLIKLRFIGNRISNECKMKASGWVMRT